MDAEGIDRRGGKINDSEGIACWPEVKETEYASFQKSTSSCKKSETIIVSPAQGRMRR